MDEDTLQPETFSALDENINSQLQERPETNLPSEITLSDNVFKSTVLSGLASLKSEVKSDLRRVE